MTDQQRADHVGFMGNRVVRTPHLDSLAASGCVFDNAWVSNPVCMPNRSTILTGRMPTAHGVIFNDRSLDWYANTFVRQLRADGYRTALLGKMGRYEEVISETTRALSGAHGGAAPSMSGALLLHFNRAVANKHLR